MPNNIYVYGVPLTLQRIAEVLGIPEPSIKKLETEKDKVLFITTVALDATQEAKLLELVRPLTLLKKYQG